MSDVEYRASLAGVGPDALGGPFFVGWPAPPSPETHLRILEGSDRIVLALDEDDRVIGFITALTDGVLSAFIPLLEVVETRQGEGIGSELVRRLITELGDLYIVDAMTDPDIVSFYERLGFVPATGVARRDYSRQSGRVASPK